MKPSETLLQAIADEELRDDNLFEITDNAMDELRLFRSEVFWRDLYLWLEEKGYRLRPRYHPDWVASWKPGDNWLLCEDAQVELVCNLTHFHFTTEGLLNNLLRMWKPLTRQSEFQMELRLH